MTLAHIGGLPVEETLGSVGPALLLALGVALGNLRARIAAGARSRGRRSGTPLGRSAAWPFSRRMFRSQLK